MTKKIPYHLGLIIDGNRRWARKRGLPTLMGHEAGYQKIKEVGDWCLERGIKVVTIYTFSYENWKRSKQEVNYLMKLILRALVDEIDYFIERGIRLKLIGRENGLSKEVVAGKKLAEKKTSKNKKALLNLAVNYTGRLEIVDAVKNIVKNKIPAGKINESVLSDNMYTAGMPDPDLIIRTSGEQRLSGFLTWQAVYSELYFCKKLWPDFSKRDFNTALNEYVKRKRRFGGN